MAMCAACGRAPSGGRATRRRDGFRYPCGIKQRTRRCCQWAYYQRAGCRKMLPTGRRYGRVRGMKRVVMMSGGLASNRSRAQGAERMIADDRGYAMIDTPGLYDIADADYHADCCAVPSLSSSIVKLLDQQTPLHAWQAHPRLNPRFEEK